MCDSVLFCYKKYIGYFHSIKLMKTAFGEFRRIIKTLHCIFLFFHISKDLIILGYQKQDFEV